MVLAVPETTIAARSAATGGRRVHFVESGLEDKMSDASTSFRMRRKYQNVALRRIADGFFACILLAFVGPAFAAVQIHVDAHDTGRIFEGIGAASGGGDVSRLLINYPEPQRSQILDYLFKPNYGASLQLLKVEIGGDGNSTEGAEPSHMHTANDQNYNRGFEWWIMEQAKRRNPNIQLMALAWDFPAWVKQADSQATTDYLVNFVEGAKRVHGLDINYLGIWNETKMPYGFIKTLKKTLAAHHLETKIIADDLVNTWAIADAIQKDHELRADVYVVATHYPHYKSTEVAKNIGKSIWSSEDGPWSDTWATPGEQSGPYAEVLNRNYIEGRMISAMLWCLVSSYYDILDIPNAGLMRAETPWSGNYKVMSPLWIVAHTTQFAQPGWRYLDHASALLPDGGSYVTLSHGNDFSLIAESITASHPQQINITLDKQFRGRPVWVWRTNKSSYFEKLKPIRPVNGTFTFTVEPDSVYSLTTTHTQHKGNAQPPAAKQFPLPYRDTFEKYSIGNTTPNYFIEQNGSYEVTKCEGGRAGKCLRQVVDASPIVWTSGTTAALLGMASIIGDKHWSNYTVSADIYLEEPGYGRVMGRVSRVTLDGQINGYQLYLHSTGRWELRTSTKGGVIASGHLASPLTTWHHAALSFHGDQVSAQIDGKEVADIRDSSYSHGMAGMGNGWNKGEYDNFEIKPVSGVPVFAPEKPVKATKPPAPPTIYVPTALNEAVRLTWSKVDGAIGYRIKFGTEKGKYTSSKDVGALNSFNITTLTNGQKYYFVVTAYNARGESGPSDVKSATPGSGT